MWWCVVACGLAACGRVGFDARSAEDARSDASPISDASTFDAPPPCPLGPWSTPVRITSVSSNDDEFGPALSPDGTVLLYQSPVGASSGIRMATRTGPTTFSAPTVPAMLNSASEEYGPAWSADGTRVYFASDRGGSLQLWVSTFDGTSFGTPTVFPELTDVDGPTLSADELELIYTTPLRPNDLRRATRPSVDAPWEALGDLGLEALNTGTTDGYPSLSTDGTTLYFETTRRGDAELFRAVRPARDQPFGAPTPVDELNQPGSDTVDADISVDDRTMLFSSNRAGGGLGYEIYISTRTCL